MKEQSHTTGYSLVEVLVSIAVLLLAIVGPMTIASQGIKSGTFSLEQNTAFFLAQEGIEALFAIRNNYALAEISGAGANSWEWIDDVLNGTGPCSISSNGDVCSFGIDFSSDTIENNITTVDCGVGNEENCRLYIDETNTRAVYTHNNLDEESPFIRIITVEQKDGDIVEVTSEVRWESSVFGGAIQNVTLTTDLFNLLP